MFTGIVEEIGTVQAVRRGASSAVLTIAARTVLTDARMGDSIAVNGVCLTLTTFTPTSFTADVMHETINRSTLRDLHVGSPVNLERAMAADGRFGGHIVAGHIDGIGTVTAVRRDDNAVWYTVRTPGSILRYVIEKGSIAVDGISLTVARVGREDFSVSVIPHTAEQTVLSRRRVGDRVNLEADCIGKYVARLLSPASARGVTSDLLTRNGFL